MINSSDNVKTRIILPAFLWIPIALALVARFYVIQIKKHDYYLSAAKESCTAKEKLEGRWGEICDRDGYLLVGNRPCLRIICSPCDIKPEKRQIVAELLSAHLGKSVEHHYARLAPTHQVVTKDGKTVERPSQYLMLGRTVPVDVGQRLKEELKNNGVSLNAFSFKSTYTRFYPKKRMLANFIGYSNLEDDKLKPQTGIEKGVSGQTAPQTGLIKMEISRDGAPLNYGLQNIQASRDGKNVCLTVSEPIQSILEEELDAACEKWRPDAIYAAIATPDGNILAIAQRPTFDLSDRSTFNNDTTRNRMIRDAFEPGSVMKPFTIAKALDWGVVIPNTRVDCEGGRWTYCGKAMEDTHPNGRITVSEIIKTSSNIGTAKIALMLGENRLEQALSGFGFGIRTGLLPHESSGTKPRPRDNDKIAITRIPIGYSINVTSLQLLRAYCTLANGGRRPNLRIIDRTEDPATGKSAPEMLEEEVQVIDNPEALRQLVEMMITVTQKGGTAKEAAIPGYDVAGKTGTSYKYVIEYYPDEPGKPRRIKWQGYKNKAPDKQYYASFAGFVPARDPKIVVVVTVDNPKGAKYGGTVAGPIFSKTAKRVLDHLNVPPDHPEELAPKDKTARRTTPNRAPAAEAHAAAPRTETGRNDARSAVAVRQKAPRPAAQRNAVRRTTTAHRPVAAPAKARKSSPQQSTRRTASAGAGRTGSTSRSEFPTMRRTWGKQEWE